MAKVWCYYGAGGRILADSSFKGEDHVWSIALGWPSEKEVEWAKQNGDLVRLIEIENYFVQPAQKPEQGGVHYGETLCGETLCGASRLYGEETEGETATTTCASAVTCPACIAKLHEKRATEVQP